jgi:PleD family two-component response regulator
MICSCFLYRAPLKGVIAAVRGPDVKVLIVEDEKMLAQLMKKGLEENSFTVDITHDGEEGMYLAENYPYDAVLLDLMLPKIDGIDLLGKRGGRCSLGKLAFFPEDVNLAKCQDHHVSIS